MHAPLRAHHKQRGAILKRGNETLHEIGGKKGGVGRDRDHVADAGPVRPDPLEPRLHAGKRPRIVSNAVGNDRQSEVPKPGEVTVRTDDDVGDLRLQPLNDAGEHRPAAERLQAFVAATHAARSAADKHDADHTL